MEKNFMHALTWNVDRVLLYLPGLHFPIYWYGLLFAIGVFLAQKRLAKDLFEKNLLSFSQIQNLIFVLIVSIVIGARVFDVIFYQNFKAYLDSPLDLFNLRQGGLSSHGGFLGFLVALKILNNKYKTPFLDLLSCMTVPAGILACFIRLGNFFNQEILGKPYSGWGSVIFSKPLNDSLPIARHPVVLYEALCYLALAFLMSRLRLDAPKKTGLALIGYFGCRGGLEIFKDSHPLYPWPFQMTTGMVLSLPLIAAGIILIFNRRSVLKTVNK
jgi:prolipoprotein diacylglyceryl transferase